MRDPKNRQKVAIWKPSHNFVGLYISSQLRHVSTVEKKLVKQRYVLHITCPHNMVNFGLLTAEIRWRVWGTWLKDRVNFLLSVIELVFYLLALRRYKAKRVKTHCLLEGVGQFEPRFQGKGSSLENIFWFLQN